MINFSINAIRPVLHIIEVCRPHAQHNMQVSLSTIPSGDSVVFGSSSFFKGGRVSRTLPSPDEIRRTASPGRNSGRPAPALFPSLGLLVKYGRAITIAEGQSLWVIRKLLGHIVPVPEIYGWRTDGDETFIYMEHIQGDTLEKRWNTLTDEERADICCQLRKMVDSWRELRQGPPDDFVGMSTRNIPRHHYFSTSESSLVSLPLDTKCVIQVTLGASPFRTRYLSSAVALLRVPSRGYQLSTTGLCVQIALNFTKQELSSIQCAPHSPTMGRLFSRTLIYTGATLSSHPKVSLVFSQSWTGINPAGILLTGSLAKPCGRPLLGMSGSRSIYP